MPPTTQWSGASVEDCLERVDVDGLVAVPVQGDAFGDVTGSLTVLALADHRDETAELAVESPQNAVLVDEGHASGLPAPVQRHHETAAGYELVKPGGR